jgi:predicted transglutaminase-like cysteine proteinase
MSVFYRPRSGTLVLALVFAVATTSSALARQNAQRAQPTAPGVMVPAPAPARYFTINQVLAKREGQRPPSPGLQLAGTSTTMTDEPPAGRHLLPTGEPFGLSTFRAPEGLLWVKWRAVQRQSQAEAGQIELCQADRASCSSHALHFLRLVEFAAARNGRARIELVNRAVNSAIRYTSDYSQHGVTDLWTAPLATLAAGRGDCEDYAIAKYAILRATGVAADDLRLLLVRDRAVRQDHAVLAVRDNGQWLILDNRHAALAETGMLPQFAPLFTLDHNGVSLFASPYAARQTPDVQPAGISPPTYVAKQGEPHGDTAAESRKASLSASTLYLL